MLPGADEYFSEGICSVDSNRLEVIVPYASHRSKTNYAGTTYSLDEINIAEEPKLIYHSKANKKVEGLIDQYVEGNNKKLASKGSYFIRDTLKVVGSQEIKQASFAIFYDDLKNPG